MDMIISQEFRQKESYLSFAVTVASVIKGVNIFVILSVSGFDNTYLIKREEVGMSNHRVVGTLPLFINGMGNKDFFFIHWLSPKSQGGIEPP
jgi:hypothetical protein